MSSSAANPVAIGVDIGGTFTDVVCLDAAGGTRLLKIPTTRSNPSAGVKTALNHLETEWGVAPRAIARFVHGTTVATNAVLERKGARIGLITTAGFKDVLEIGRQMRHAMYDLALQPQTPVFLAPGAFRKEATERVDAVGDVLVPLDEATVVQAVDELVAEGVAAIAVCYLFSFVNPSHELRTREVIHRLYPELMVSLSCEVDPAFREYERTCATAFDAYVKPVVGRYIEHMERDLADAGVAAPLQIMQSRGGIGSSAVARQRPVRLFLSGPAAGVVGALEVGRSVGIGDLITVDVGGTSCDVALVSGGAPLNRAEGVIGGYVVRVPMVDVSTIGAGGGSIAWLDGAGALRVGPESAGSEPGPACYDRGGTVATVTDASVILGYIDPDYFAGGSLRLVPERARAIVEQTIAHPLGMTVEAAAIGIHRVLNAQMAEAIRLVSIGRGIDPRGYALLPLGGGGPLHACALARELSMTRIVVPPHPGVLSAAGLLFAPVEHEISAAFSRRLDTTDWRDAQAMLDNLDAACGKLMRDEGVPAERTDIRYFADMCYVGQSYHLEIALSTGSANPLGAVYRDFLSAHDRVYGHSTEAPARIVNLRTVHRSEVERLVAAVFAGREGGAARKADRRILTDDGHVTVAVYDRTALSAGAAIEGPAIVEQVDTTTLIEPGWRGIVAANGTLLLTATK
ncbi:MAG TPA: hydantoinase/oxoprolinase family protein [Stellaceae bacterium]|jgi:N-methylhydantoinase A/oxoprolinase/acetone carboxylase beta subunit|nr:hydantoinase/oxoprolinase family protein [Stellaceae bacterium]